MIRLTLCLAATLALVGCSKNMDAPANSTRSGSPVPLALDEVDAPGTLTVTSPAFGDGARIPVTYSAYGEDASPPLKIANVPARTQSFAIIVDDPDAKEPKPFVHWVLWNLPAEMSELRTAVPAMGQVRQLMNTKQGANSRGSMGYFGPKPPMGDPPHHYHFQVFALDTKLDLEQGATKAQLLAAMKGRVLAKGQLVGTFAKAKE